MSKELSDILARVRPLVGDVLQQRTVALLGAPAALVVEYLAACGVQRWVIAAGNAWMDAVVARLRARFGASWPIVVTVVPSPAAIDADLVVIVDDGALARRLPATYPRLAIFTPQSGQACRAYVAWAGERFDAEVCPGLTTVASERTDVVGAGWDWACAAPLVALWARAILLQETAYAMSSWDAARVQRHRAYTIGSAHDPTRARWDTEVGAAAQAPSYRAPVRPRGTLLIAGVGSLGSVAACALAPHVARLVLVDPDRVEPPNLARQAFTRCQVGMAKADALAQTLGDQVAVIPVVDALHDERQVGALLRTYEATAVLVTTGTQADFAIARAAQAAGIAHVVGRCYARARYWEGVVVDAAHGDGYATPVYAEVRRQVALGPIPMPTPEEMAAYGAPDALVAEPATGMETGWAAQWLARLTAQMMLPATLREGWLLARLAAGATCFVGGLVVEQVGAERAYGVHVPGEVHAWSGAEIGVKAGARVA